MNNHSSYSSVYLSPKSRHEMWSAAAGTVVIKLYPAYANDANQWQNQRGASVDLEIDVKEKAAGTQEFELELDQTQLETIEAFTEEAKERSKKKN